GGPSSAKARDSSKRNALKHGLMAETIFPDELQKDIDRYTALLLSIYAPRDDNQRWLVGQIAKGRAKLDHLGVLQAVDRQRRIDRVPLAWDADRRVHVHDLGARLAKDTRRARELLGQTKQGAQWMRELWSQL